MYANKLRPVLCGGEPTPDDQSLQGGLDIVHYAATLKIANPYTGLAAQLCPACVALLPAKKGPV
jgi:hypothetical protein